MKKTFNILVGSNNLSKIEATKEAFSKFFDNINVKGIKIDTNVSLQPFNDETYKGAYNRAKNVKKFYNSKNKKYNFFVGIEAGIIKYVSNWFVTAYICILDGYGNKGFASSSSFQIPNKIVKHLKKGKELSIIIDEILEKRNTKKKYEREVIGFFTNGVLMRKQLYVPGVICALVPFLNKDLFFNK